MQDTFSIELLENYSDKDAIMIGKLLPMLSHKFSDTPASRELLEEIISSPHHAQLVARSNNTIVGIATLSITIGIGAGHKAYLEDFIVDPRQQGKGIGSALWDEIASWCIKNDVKLHFTSNATREAAHAFYLKHGATVYDTTVFNYDPR